MFKQPHNLIGVVLLSLVTIQLASPANLGPPPGPILNLAGQPLPTSFTNYSVTFIAALANTDLLFALRDDPGFLALDDISMVDNTTPSGNLVVNGGFETLDASNDPTGWTLHPNGVNNPPDFLNLNAGSVTSYGGCAVITARTGNVWCDGSVEGYDAIDQNIATTIGDSYTVSFGLISVLAPPADTLFQALSINGLAGQNGNGIDVAVYAQSQLPSGVPEPVSMLLFGSGLAGIGLLGRRRAKRA